MATYILRDLPAAWEGFKARATRDGWRLRALLLQLIDDYAAGRITPTAAPPPDRPRPGT